MLCSSRGFFHFSSSSLLECYRLIRVYYNISIIHALLSACSVELSLIPLHQTSLIITMVSFFSYADYPPHLSFFFLPVLLFKISSFLYVRRFFFTSLHEILYVHKISCLLNVSTHFLLAFSLPTSSFSSKRHHLYILQ